MEISHSLYTGVTKSGKTTLARLASRANSEKRTTIVYDPLGTSTLGGDWGKGAIVYDELEPFFDHIYAPKFVSADIYIDEAHHVFAHADKSHLWLLTQGRHYDFRIGVITQRPTKVHPDARTNCERCYMFRLAQDDAKAIGLDYGFSDIHKISLDRGDFLLLNSGTANFSRGNVFSLVQPSKG